MERLAQKEQEINELKMQHEEKLAELMGLKKDIELENKECLQNDSER